MPSRAGLLAPLLVLPCCCVVSIKLQPCSMLHRASRHLLLLHPRCPLSPTHPLPAAPYPPAPQVTFLYRLSDGACPKSYGTNVARLAGLPDSVVRRAAAKAAESEAARTGGGQGAAAGAPSGGGEGADGGQGEEAGMEVDGGERGGGGEAAMLARVCAACRAAAAGDAAAADAVVQLQREVRQLLRVE